MVKVIRPVIPGLSGTVAHLGLGQRCIRRDRAACLWREHSEVSVVRSRVSARRSRIGSGGTNEGRSMPRSFNSHNQMQSSLSVFGRPGTCFTSRALTSHTCSPAASSR